MTKCLKSVLTKPAKGLLSAQIDFTLQQSTNSGTSKNAEHAEEDVCLIGSEVRSVNCTRFILWSVEQDEQSLSTCSTTPFVRSRKRYESLKSTKNFESSISSEVVHKSKACTLTALRNHFFHPRFCVFFFLLLHGDGLAPFAERFRKSLDFSISTFYLLSPLPYSSLASLILNPRYCRSRKVQGCMNLPPVSLTHKYGRAVMIAQFDSLPLP